MHNPYEAYKKQSIMTMTPTDMLTALYDGLLKELSFASAAFEQSDYGKINDHLQRSQRILRHLQTSLDFQYEISQQLDSLYDYFIQVTVQANVKKDPAGLADVIQMIRELRDTYVQAEKQTHPSAAAR